MCNNVKKILDYSVTFSKTKNGERVSISDEDKLRMQKILNTTYQKEGYEIRIEKLKENTVIFQSSKG
jgi:hypothetical protein